MTVASVSVEAFSFYVRCFITVQHLTFPYDFNSMFICNFLRLRCDRVSFAFDKEDRKLWLNRLNYVDNKEILNKYIA
jgi:hypothetical protein